MRCNRWTKAPRAHAAIRKPGGSGRKSNLTKLSLQGLGPSNTMVQGGYVPVHTKLATASVETPGCIAGRQRD